MKLQLLAGCVVLAALNAPGALRELRGSGRGPERLAVAAQPSPARAPDRGRDRASGVTRGTEKAAAGTVLAHRGPILSVLPRF